MPVVPPDFWLLVGSEDSREELRRLTEAAMDGTPKKTAAAVDVKPN